MRDRRFMLFVSSTRHLPHPCGIRSVRLDLEVAAECCLRFRLPALLHQRDAMPAPGIRRSVGINNRGRIALRSANIVARAIAQAPDFAFVESEQTVPAVLGQGLESNIRLHQDR